jgi:hypothetical protein
MTKVTAIVSAYYAEDYLMDRITNLKAQTAEPDIIVVCQHGSKEHDLVIGCGGVDILTTKDVPTIYDAWNMAISKAQTPYITNANCDDRHYPGALERLANELDMRDRVGVAFSDVDRQEGYNKPLHWKRVSPGSSLKQRCFIGPMPMWRRSLHDEHGMFDHTLTVVGDYDFWLRLAANGIEFVYIGEPLGCYVARSDSLEHRDKRVTMDEKHMVILRHKDDAQEAVIWHA